MCASGDEPPVRESDRSAERLDIIDGSSKDLSICRGYNALPVGRRIQASELELPGRAISNADGLPPLLLLGGEFTHEQVEGMDSRMQREEGRVGSSDWPKKPPLERAQHASRPQACASY